eukprot:TRINITY_DN12029_c2_g1_i2.p3 TRINITY_DN12029_c2_g1~~TRINITY_DN12029_c2_g1_i2.p3  ORF type:complete len:101 (-),score=2.33 TRINITY_DN12029_c2_g1_i2:79-381(-)
MQLSNIYEIVGQNPLLVIDNLMRASHSLRTTGSPPSVTTPQTFIPCIALTTSPFANRVSPSGIASIGVHSWTSCSRSSVNACFFRSTFGSTAVRVKLLSA